MTYRIGTRGSRLARIQANLVRDRLTTAFPNDAFEIVVIGTRGDREADRPIAEIGDNALFTREIEVALAEGEIDLAVHSMKDLPAECPAGLRLTKAWPRADARDVLVARGDVRSVDSLPAGAVVATGSPRRTVLLRQMRHDLHIIDIRGNVDTRLRKLFDPKPDEPKIDAVVLAAAGLQRLGREDVITQFLDLEQMVPAPNQGQLAIEIRDDDKELGAKLDSLGTDDDERIAQAERLFLKELGADCRMPVGAFATVLEGGVSLYCAFAADESHEPVFVREFGRTAQDAAMKSAQALRRRVAGKVLLVGAGPGDPDLITVKGLKALREADVIVYDHLVSDELLKEAKSGCELVYAGKACGAHAMLQDEINVLLAKKALSNRLVVRLKGGDPFVFGRGGEESIFLAAHGISCSVVPGVTSAVAAAGSVGIPVTHRGVASVFEVVTARTHEGPSGKTRVYLMGSDRIGDIVRELTSSGLPRNTPVAVVGSATLPNQKCVVGTLDDIAEKVGRSAVPSPAVTIVGDVVRLRERMGKPLSGKRFLVPFIEGGEKRLVRLLSGLGAEVDGLAVGRIEPVVGALDEHCLSDVTWLLFTSRSGLLPFVPALVDAVKRRGIHIAAIGPVTAAAIAGLGMSVDFVPKVRTGAGLRAGLSVLLNRGDVVVHPTAGDIDSPLSGLSDVCDYRAVAVYRNDETRIGRIDLSGYDAAFFTCASSARRLYAKAVGDTRTVAIGPATRAALEASGARKVVQARNPDLESLVEAVLEG